MGKKWSKTEEKILTTLTTKYREQNFDNYVISEKLKYQFPNRSTEAIRVRISNLMPIKSYKKKKARAVVKTTKKTDTFFGIKARIDKVNKLIAHRQELIARATQIELELSKLLRL